MCIPFILKTNQLWLVFLVSVSDLSKNNCVAFVLSAHVKLDTVQMESDHLCENRACITRVSNPS